MSRRRRARRIARVAAYGGGGIGLLASALTALLVAEAKLARRAVGVPTIEPPLADGVYGRGRGKPIELIVAGDSSAAGLGVHDPLETPGALLAAGLSTVAQRRVRLTVVAKSGAQTSDLDRQIDEALGSVPKADAAVVMIGANDVTHRVRPSVSVRLLALAVRRLRAAGCEVIVGTCPDLGTVEPIAQPLRYIARRISRHLASAQTIAAVEAGGRTVSLGDILGPEFSARPSEMFGPDRFHPSATGYASAAMAVLPSVCAALGYWPADEEPSFVPGENVLPIAFAAVEAAESAGTEVAGTAVSGRERGPRGRWALLRQRRRQPVPDLAEVEPDLSADGSEDTDEGLAGRSSASYGNRTGVTDQ